MLYVLGFVFSVTRTSAKNVASNWTDTTEVLSDPETPENERKNVFGGNYYYHMHTAHWLNLSNCWYECFVMQRWEVKRSLQQQDNHFLNKCAKPLLENQQVRLPAIHGFPFCLER